MDSAIPRLPVRLDYIKRLTSALLYGANGLSNVIPNIKQRIWTKTGKANANKISQHPLQILEVPYSICTLSLKSPSEAIFFTEPAK